jgi:hypothetical protein
MLEELNLQNMWKELVGEKEMTVYDNCKKLIAAFARRGHLEVCKLDLERAIMMYHGSDKRTIARYMTTMVSTGLIVSTSFYRGQPYYKINPEALVLNNTRLTEWLEK